MILVPGDSSAMPRLPIVDLDHVLQWTLPYWDRLRGARLFITGGTGFFGSWLLESLAWVADRQKIPIEAVVLTRSPAAFALRKPHLAEHRVIRLHSGDIRNFTFPDGRFTHVIHGAFPSGSPPSSMSEISSLMLSGTERTLEFCREADVGSYLFISSGAVYGRQPDHLAEIPETYCATLESAHSRSAYGEAKYLAELTCCHRAGQTGLAVKIARCFAFVGPGLPLDAHFAIGNFLRDALHDGPIAVNGDGTAVRSYLYAADLAVWLWALLVRGESGRAYNVGSPHALSLAELADLIVREIAPDASVQIRQRLDPTKPVERYVPHVGRAAVEMQLIPRIPLAEALRRTAEWARRLPLTSA